MRSLIDTSDPMLRVYLMDFVLALVLTIIPFGLVVLNVLPKMPALALIAILAAGQITVHLHYFLHLNFGVSDHVQSALPDDGLIISARSGTRRSRRAWNNMADAEKPKSLKALRAAEAACTRCPLYKNATQVVPGGGPRGGS